MRTLLFREFVKNKISKKRAETLSEKFKGAEFIGRGRHSVVIKQNKKAIKIEKDIPSAEKSIEREAYFLKILNKYNIGSKLRDYSKVHRYVRYDFIKGDFLIDFLKKEDNERKKLSAIRTCFEKAFTLDLLRINKEEFHRPLKHIIIGKQVKFIDFERCKYTKQPKNVSQLISFFFKTDAYNRQIRKYKKKISRKNFDMLMKTLELNKVPLF